MRAEGGESDRAEDRDRPREREAWFRSGRQAKGESAAALRYRAWRQKRQMEVEQRLRLSGTSPQTSASAPATNSAGVAISMPGPGTDPPWSALGPAPLISDPTGFQDYGFVTGRTTAVVVDPCDTTGNTVYVGGAYGGVWKSTNAANSNATLVTWTPLIDNQATLAVGAIAVQPNTCNVNNASNVILVGTGEPNSSADSYYGLGILRSADGGATWTLTTSADGSVHPFHGLGFSKIAFSTTSPQTVVAASAATIGASIGGEFTGTTRGLYYATDGGVNGSTSWKLATINETNFNPGSAPSVVFNPLQGSSGTFYAAIRFHGLYASADGITWTRLTNQPGTMLTTTNCPATTNTACPLYRGELAVRPGRNEMYAFYVNSSEADQGVYKSTDGGATWTTIPTNTGLDNCGSESGCGTSQGTYNLYIAAVPNGNDTDLYAGAINIYKCFVGATDTAPCSTMGAWKNLTHVYGCGSTGTVAAPSHLHPDQHAIDFSRNTAGLIYFGNDGGIYRTTNGAATADGTCTAGNPFPFQNLNQNMGSMTQFFSFSQHPTDAATLLGGTQDNGSPAVDSTHSGSNGVTWTEVNSGDGGFNAIDPNSPLVWYTANTKVSVQRCGSGITCNAGTFPTVVGSTQVSGDDSGFYTPYLLDPQNNNNIILGTCRVWRGPANNAAGWSSSNALSNNFDLGTATLCARSTSMNHTSKVRSLAAGGPVVAGNSQVIYAGMSGPDDLGGLGPAAGEIFATTNGGANWTNVIGATSCNLAGSINPGCHDVSDIALDPADSTGKTAYATIMGFGGGHIFKTTNAGAVWTNITANLPDAPANSVLVDPFNSSIIYVGNDVGVFVTRDGGTTWNPYGSSGLPNVVVTWVLAFSPGKKLRASTHGRGVWQIDLASGGLPAGVSFSPASLSFPSTVIGRRSAPLSMTMINNTGGTVNISSISVGGDFSQGNNCPAALAGGASCAITVTFKPTAAGTRSANVTVSDSAGGHSAAVSGTGADFTIALSRPGRPPRTSSANVVLVGQSAGFSVSLSGSAGFDADVALACSGAPAGASCVAPSSVHVSDGTTVLNVVVNTSASTLRLRKRLGKFVRSGGTRPGTYHLQLTASVGLLTHSQELVLTVEAPAPERQATERIARHRPRFSRP